MAGFMDMIKKAKENIKPDRVQEEYLAQNMNAEILIHCLKFFENDSGKWGALVGEITKSSPSKSDATAQPVGTRIKVVWKCHGKFLLIGYGDMYKAVKATFGAETDEEMNISLQTCFGSSENRFTKEATAEDQQVLGFAARGFLVNVSTRPAGDVEKRKAEGKTIFTDIKYTHIDQTPEEVAERASRLPAIN